MAKNEGEIIQDGEGIVYFAIDTQSPRILNTYPKKGFSNGTFGLEFKEAKPTRIRLFYGNSNKNTNHTFFGINNICDKDGTSYQCPINVDLNLNSNFENKEINYGFEVVDYFNRSGTSRIYRVIVDTISPVLNDVHYKINGRKVSFVFNITENNFDKVSYYDTNDNTARMKTLCYRLMNGVCEVTKIFSYGNHNLTISVLDDAGNTIHKKIEFTI